MGASNWQRLVSRVQKVLRGEPTSAKRADKRPATPQVAPFTLKQPSAPTPEKNSAAAALTAPAGHAWLTVFGGGRSEHHAEATIDIESGIAGMDSADESFGDEAILASLRLQLADVDEVPLLSNLTHVRAYAPGLVELLAVCTPENVIAPPATDLARLGSPQELVDRGRANLVDSLAEVGQSIEVRRFETTEGLSFTGLLGESLSVASLAIVLPQLVHLLHPGESLGKGVFVAMPNAHHLAFRVADDMSSLMSVGPMSVFARNGYADRGSTTPHVYWAHGPRLDTLVPLTRHDDDHIAIHIPGDLAEILDH